MRCVCFVFIITSGGCVCVCELRIGVVVMAGGRFLGSGLVGDVGRTSAVSFCCGGVLVGKRVIV